MGKFSAVPEVHLDLQLKGKHLDYLSKADPIAFDKTAIAILRELMDENPDMPSQRELYYLWLLVKVNSLGPTLNATANCTKDAWVTSRGERTEKKCGATLNVTINLLESDVVRIPGDYKLPTVELELRTGRETFSVKPPVIKEESFLLDIFQEQGYSREDIVDFENKPDLAMRFAKHRMLLYLCDENGRAFPDFDMRENAIKKLGDDNLLKDVEKLYNAVAEVDKFGVKFTSQVVTCPSCKSRVQVQLPLSAGLAFRSGSRSNGSS
jgi:hypothetical protein